MFRIGIWLIWSWEAEPEHIFSAIEIKTPDASTGGPKAAVDVRVTDLLIRATAFPRLLTGAKSAAKAVEPSPKKYAQTYHEPFKGQPQKPEDFVLIGANTWRWIGFATVTPLKL